MDIVEELDPLFNPKSVAVIGATNDWNKWGYSTFSSALYGFKGDVYPVNWKTKKILDHDAFKRITDIPGPVDMAIFVIPAENIPSVMEDCVEKGVKAGVIISAGFRETGEEGRKLEDDVLRIARRGGLRFVGSNCMGMWSASSDLRAFMFPIPVRDGPLAFVTQGGNVGGAIAMSAYERGIGFHRYVSCGSAADIQIEDYIEYFGKDPKVKVILTYIEGLGDGRRFIEKVAPVTMEKPVIALKPGKSEATAKAIMSHSGSISGSEVIYDEAFKKTGVIRVETTEELLDLATGFLTQPLPNGRNVGIATPGGSYGVLCTDACESLGLNVIELPEETIHEFDKFLPPRWSHGNPVDPAGDRNLPAYLKAPELLLKLDQIDSLIFMGFGNFSGLASSLTTAEGSAFASPISAMSFISPSTTGMDKLMESFTADIASGDVSKIDKFVKPISFMLSSAFGSEKDQADDFVRLFSSAVASGEIEPSTLEVMLQSFSSVTEGTADMDGLVKKMDQFLGGMMIHLIKTYKKPIVTTTFSEGISRLQGGYYAYSSGDRAAKVLAKLVEYREHLERTGAQKDRFEICELIK